MHDRWLIAATVLSSLIIAVADSMLPSGKAVVILFMIPVIAAGRIRWRSAVVATASFCVVLNIGTYVIRHGITGFHEPYIVRRILSIVATVIAAYITLRMRTLEAEKIEKQLLVDLATDAIFTRAADGTVLRWSQGAERLYGITANQAIGRKAATLLAPGPPEVLLAAELALRLNGHWLGEIFQRTKDGRTFAVLSHWSLRRDNRGRLTEILESNADISARKQAERRLIDSAERYHRIFHASGVAMWEEDYTQTQQVLSKLRSRGVIDLQTFLLSNMEVLREVLQTVRVLDVNDKAVALFGTGGAEGFRSLHTTMLATGSPQMHALHLEAILENATSFEAETSASKVNGEPLHIVKVVRFSFDRPGHAFISAIDVGARLRLEQQRDDLDAAVARNSHSVTLGALAVHVSNDLIGPIADIAAHGRTCLSALRETAGGIQTLSSGLSAILRESCKAAEAIAFVRSFVRRKAAPHEAVDLAESMENAIYLVKRQIARNAVLVLRNIGPDRARFIGDRLRIEHLLVQLLLSAIEALGKTIGQTRYLKVSLQKKDGEAIVRIGYNACDIDPVTFVPLARRSSDIVAAMREDELNWTICQSTILAHGANHSMIAVPGAGIVHEVRFDLNEQIVVE